MPNPKPSKLAHKNSVKSRQISRDANKEVFLDAFENNYAYVLKTCRMIGIVPETYYRWLDEDAEFKAKVDFIKKLSIEEVEFQFVDFIKRNVRNENQAAHIFYLKAKAGWREEKETPEDSNINLTVTYSD